MPHLFHIGARSFLYGLLLSFMPALFAAPAAAPPVERPNLIVIMADDLGPGELSAYGSHEIQTPRLDALAADGVRIETCYATPVCAPTRIMIMTGLYGFQTDYFNMGARPGGPKSYDPMLDFTEEQVTFANLLKDQGYATAIAGKWQLIPPTFDKIPAAGFDEHLVWQIFHVPGHGVLELKPDGTRRGPGSRYFHPSLSRNGDLLVTEPDDFGPDFCADFLIEFLERHKDQPVLLYYPMILPHEPIGPTPDHPDLEVDGSTETLKANVEYMDKLVGRLVDAVDEMGLSDRTYFIFTGDNGTERRGKNTPTEAGARVPLIVRGPGVQQGVVSGVLTDLTDILPTLTDLGGASLPADRDYLGKSLWPVLSGQNDEHRDWIFSYLGQFRVLRTRDWLLEAESPDYAGDFYFCGDARGGLDEYLEVTDYDHPKVRAARAHFEEILRDLPAPKLTEAARVWFLRYLENYSSYYSLDRAYPPGHDVDAPNDSDPPMVDRAAIR